MTFTNAAFIIVGNIVTGFAIFDLGTHPGQGQGQSFSMGFVLFEKV
jgi:hypothetical protein